MELITTTEELATTCERLARHPFVTIDTEFLRETTYYPLLCVAQLASSDEAVVIDALAPDIDLKPFFELMANEKVLKVFHAARQDIEIVWHRANIIPHPIFDTQVAAMVLGHGDSISYDQLVQRITGDTLDKSNRSPTGPGGPFCRPRSAMRSPMSLTCATSVRPWSPILDGADAPTGWTTRWRSSPRPTPTVPIRLGLGCGSRPGCASPRTWPS